MLWFAVTLAGLSVAASSLPYDPAFVEPQPLPEGTADTGINVLFDSSHQFTFFMHWNVQGALRAAGHRVTGNQAALHHALVPGSAMRVRDQRRHGWSQDRPHRPFVMLPAPEFDVLITYQWGKNQPYLPEEKETLRRFLESGKGIIAIGSAPDSPLARLLADYGATSAGKWRRISRAADGVPGLDQVLPVRCRAGRVDGHWTPLALDGTRRYVAVARRKVGKGTLFWVTDERILHVRRQGRSRPNTELLSWMVTEAAGGPKSRDDERRIPWEHGGIGGAFYPENEMPVGAVRVYYADNQLPDIIELARTRFTEVMRLLQKMLPTPPNPGGTFYIVLAAGTGGGWAENVYTPKLAGIIDRNHNAILSVLAHELAHTMYGPEAKDGTPGCALPAWFSEAHAGWFQRKVCRELGIGPGWPYFDRGLAREDPTLSKLDLANIPKGKMGLAWHKAWLIWSILDARYGEKWYPNWLAHIHRKYNDPSRKLTMDEYVRTISETVGEDVAPLFERFGTTLGPDARTDLPPIDRTSW